MKLLVCVKIVQDVDDVLIEDWEQAGTPSFDIAYAKAVINTCDESALELALRFKDERIRAGQPCEVWILTVGGSGCDSHLKNMLSAGATKAVRLGHTGRTGSVAGLISQYTQTREFDAVIFGAQALPMDNGITGYVYSELTGMACVPEVISFSQAKHGLRLKARTDCGVLECAVETPVVLIVGHVEGCSLRMMTLRERMAARNKTVEVITLESVDAIVEDTPELFYCRAQKQCKIIEAGTVSEKARTVYDEYLSKC